MSAPALYWLALVVGFLGVVAYFGAVAMRPRWVRMVNGSGLFFSGLGLMQLALVVRSVRLDGAVINANAAVIAVSVAVAAQAWAALRNRRAWDGVDRREPSGQG